MQRNYRISLLVFGIFILIILPTFVSATTNFQITLVKGTEERTVTQYNDSSWKSTVGSSITPNDWFQGDTNITNAKSKNTLLGWTPNTWHLYDGLITLILPQSYNTLETYALLTFLNGLGYNETTINENYTASYDIFYGLRSVWNFTNSPFKEEPSYTDEIFVFKDPMDYKTMLEDYNDLAGVLNGDPVIQFSNYSFSNISADDFLWKYALKGFAIASPQSDYLAELVSQLECNNVTASGSTLTFERHGLTNYTVLISYGEKGTISSFTVKDLNGITIFQFTSSNTEWIFYLILIIAISISVALVILIIVRKRKLKSRT
jgi:hypothetical protein